MDSSPANASADRSAQPPHVIPGPCPAEASAGRSHPPPIAVSLPSCTRNSCESAALKIKVGLVGCDGLEVYEVVASSEHTLCDLKIFFERLKGSALYPIRKLVASQNGLTLANAEQVKDLDLGMSVSIIALLEPRERVIPSSNLPAFPENWTDEILAMPMHHAVHVGAPEEILPDNYSLWDIPFTEFSILEVSESTNVISNPGDHSPFDVENQLDVCEVLTSTAPNENTNIEVVTSALPTESIPATAQADIAETSTSVVPQCPQRLLVPSNFSDQTLLEANLHGFKTSYQLRDDMNRGPARWITREEAYALISNPQFFSICAVREEDKIDCLVCVIDSRICSLPERVKGYRVAPNAESVENPLGDMKCKGVAMDRFEARGKNLFRRRLSLHANDSGFHVVQWRQFAIGQRQIPEATTEVRDARNTSESPTAVMSGINELQTMLNSHSATLDRLVGQHEAQRKMLE